MKVGKLNPTLFDKLTLGDRVTAVIDSGRSDLQDSQPLAETRLHLERYGETALRASVRRELNWLLNSVQLGAGTDLSRTPQVKTSVLNYGLPDLAGRSANERGVRARAEEMAVAIRAFEPRLDPGSLQVVGTPGVGADNAVSYVIKGDITAAVSALPVRFLAAVEAETGEAVVEE